MLLACASDTQASGIHLSTCAVSLTTYAKMSIICSAEDLKMSIAVDLGLFLRNSLSKLGLSLTQRGVLFTLAIRVGNNASTWISQETLAIELGIIERNVRLNMSKIKPTKLILVEQQKGDKRKNQYSFNPLLFNYHQLNDKEKAAVHKKLGDVYLPIGQSNTPGDKHKYRSKSAGNNLNSGRNRPVDRGRNRPIVDVTKTSEALDTPAFSGDANSPKETAYSNTYNQNNRATRCSVNLVSYPDDFFPENQAREALTYHAQRTNNSENYLLARFEFIMKKYKAKSKDWQEKFIEFLKEEMPKRTYEDDKGQKRRYDNQSMNH